MTDTGADQWSQEETNTAFILGGLFVLALIAWRNEYNDALNKWEEIQDRYLDMMEELSDCYCNVTFPVQIKAIETACGFSVPEPDCAELGSWRACATDITARYKEAEDCYREQFCFGPDEAICDTTWSHIRESGAANATQQKWAADQRRNERMLEERVRILNGAKAAAWIDSSPIGTLAAAATGKINTLVGGASSGFNATAQAFSFGLSQAAGDFGGD